MGLSKDSPFSIRKEIVLAGEYRGKYYQQAKRESRNLERRIESAIDRGYRITGGDAPPEFPAGGGWREYKKYVSDLNNWKNSEFYEHFTAISEETGDVISGTEKRKEERSQAAKKGAETRKNRSEDDDWKKDRERKDKEESDRAIKDREYREKIERGNLIIDSVYQTINDSTQGRPKSREHLKEVLDNEIATYGRDAVAQAIAPYEGAFLAQCEAALTYSQTDGRHLGAIQRIEEMIRGHILSAEEAINVQNAIDYDEYEEEEY